MVSVIECEIGKSRSWQVTLLNGGEVCGFATIYKVDESVCSLVRVCVDPPRRGNGHGTDLVRACIRAAAGLGFVRMDCGPVGGDSRLVSFYERFGFRMTSDFMTNGDPVMELFLLDCGDGWEDSAMSESPNATSLVRPLVERDELIKIANIIHDFASGPFPWGGCKCDYGWDGRAPLRGEKCDRCKALARLREIEANAQVESGGE